MTLFDQSYNLPNMSTQLNYPLINSIQMDLNNFQYNSNLAQEMSAILQFKNTNNEDINSAKMNKKPKRVYLCAICGDQAFGKHYSVRSCNGCKNFFFRSIWQCKTYKCRFDNNCYIGKEQRNSCRACRLSTCYSVGMNPKAVQTERDNRRSSVSSVTPTELATLQAPNKEFGKLDDNLDSNSPNTPSTSDQLSPNIAIAEYYKNEGKHIANLYAQMLQFNELDNTVFRKSILELNLNTITFELAFQNPLLLCERSRIVTEGFRIARVEDIYYDWKRCFVLFVDLVKRIPEFSALSKEDQINLGKLKFTSIHWLLIVLWSAESNTSGLCYSNGSYYPFECNLRCIQDSTSSVDKIKRSLIEPLRHLHLDGIEKSSLLLLTLFSDPFMECEVSSDSFNLISNAKNKYLSILHFHITDNNNIIHHQNDIKQLKASLRLSKIINIVNTIQALSTSNGKNGKLDDNLILTNFRL